MKCHIDKDGYLNVSAETETELYALRMWWVQDCSKVKNGVLRVELDRVNPEFCLKEGPVSYDDMNLKELFDNCMQRDGHVLVRDVDGSVQMVWPINKPTWVPEPGEETGRRLREYGEKNQIESFTVTLKDGEVIKFPASQLDKIIFYSKEVEAFLKKW